ncbi:hypothetical protein A2U01_0104564, partial [Trifolium medium]|nr:hypothetical protein [Trifolium medium]
ASRPVMALPPKAQDQCQPQALAQVGADKRAPISSNALD